jgi:dimeric dUTPase (all-alpha-NTP-PPase superfamily)
MDSMDCKLDKMLELREAFMTSLAKRQPNVLQKWPVDIKEKASQQVVRDTVLKGVEEMFEALQHLKNWKPHRNTEIKDFDHDAFLEEYVDAFNYFLAVLVMLGIGADELFDAYVKKDSIIHDRLKTGY